MIERLREYPSPEELATMYAKPHDSTHSHYHQTRISATMMLLAGYLLGKRQQQPHLTLADLSTGDAAIPRGVECLTANQYLGDFAPGYGFTGPIEETIKECPWVDVFLLNETLEHVAEPLELLKQVREKCDALVLSTPLGEVACGNPQHVWGWDAKGIMDLLTDAGFRGRGQVTALNLKQYGCEYDFQIWLVGVV
jgi:hypothetical protein